MRKEHKLDKHWERCKKPHNFEENLRKVWEGSPKRKMERRSRDWTIQNMSEEEGRKQRHISQNERANMQEGVTETGPLLSLVVFVCAQFQRIFSSHSQLPITELNLKCVQGQKKHVLATTGNTWNDHSDGLGNQFNSTLGVG